MALIEAGQPRMWGHSFCVSNTYTNIARAAAPAGTTLSWNRLPSINEDKPRFDWGRSVVEEAGVYHLSLLVELIALTQRSADTLGKAKFLLCRRLTSVI